MLVKTTFDHRDQVFKLSGQQLIDILFSIREVQNFHSNELPFLVYVDNESFIHLKGFLYLAAIYLYIRGISLGIMVDDIF